MSVELGPAHLLSIGERVELFNRAYEGYVVPFQLDETMLAFMDNAFDIDLDASRVAFREGDPVGLGQLGVRGEDAWIGGVGVVSAARRQGLGETLMRALNDEARARGVQRVWLEVIVENIGAFALYEKLGYRVTRGLEVWSLPAKTEAGAAREVPFAQAHARIRELHAPDEPWQRADGTLAHYADARGLETDAGAAVFRIGGVVQLLQIAGGDTYELLRALREHGTVSVLNLPDDDRAAGSLRALGATAVVRQHEMLLEL